MSNGHSTAVGAYLDEAPIGRQHWKTLGLLGAGGFFDGFDIYLAGSVLSSLVATHFLTVHSSASFLSATFLGLLLGTLVGGKLGDRYGRRATYLYSLLLYGVATLITAVAADAWQMIILRGIAGLGLGAVLVAGYGMWSELTPRRQRGRWAGVLALIINISQPASAGLALLVIPSLGWRFMFVIAGAPAFVVWFLQVRYLCESPRWLEAHGRVAEAFRVARKFNPATPEHVVSGARVPGHEATVVPAPAPASGHVTSVVQKVRTRDLFRGNLKRITLVAIVVSLCGQVPYYAFQSWVPTYLVEDGYSIATTLTFSFIMQMGAIPGNLFGGYIGDKLGRRRALPIIFVLLGVLGIAYSYPVNVAELVAVGFVWVTVANMMVALTIASYVPELFPTPVRMQGSALANAFGRAGTVVSPFAVAWLFLTFRAPGVFLASLIMFVIGAVVVLWLGSETGGKSLEEIAGRHLQRRTTVPDTADDAAVVQG